MTTGTTPIQLSPDQNFEHMIGQGHIVGNLVFLSGQASISPEREIVGIGDIDAQIEQAMANVERALKAAVGSEPGAAHSSRAWHSAGTRAFHLPWIAKIRGRKTHAI
jgi:enamine deaminase RidA (YjgF/YER057c/UK114 family)